MVYQSYLCTLAQVKTAFKTTSNSTADDDDLLSAIEEVSERFQAGYPLEPVLRVKGYDVGKNNISTDGTILYLFYPLLELDSITISGIAVDLDDCTLLPTGDTPATAIQRETGSWNEYTGTRKNAIQITGYWGYHPEYSDAFTTLTALNGGINSSVTTVTVDNGAVLSPGMMLRIVTDDTPEFMRVLSIATHVATVKRGINGTTAAAHLDNTEVEVYEPMAQVASKVARQAAYIVHRRGAFEDKRIIPESGVSIQYSWDLLPDVQSVIKRLPSYRQKFFAVEDQ